MPFTGNHICTSFKTQLLQGKHDFTAATGHTFKLALYSSAASLNSETTDYTATDEVTGTNYSAGGAALTSLGMSVTHGNTVFVDFSDLTFSDVTLTARGALIYNSTTDGGGSTTDAVMVLDFGRDLIFNEQNCVIQFPTGDYTNAIIRI